MKDLHCVDDIVGSEPSLTHRIMWDQPDFPPSIVDPETAFFDYDPNMAGSNYPILRSRNRHFFRYLPLYNGDEYIVGLTVYTFGGNVTGVEAHFKRVSRLSGLRLGCPQYFPLQPNERIAYIWLRVYELDSPVFCQRTFDVSNMQHLCLS